MTDYNVSRLGQINAAGDTDAIFLKVFPGNVLGAFNTANKIMALHQVKTISSGKSAQFPAIGTTVANYHVPGTELTGNVINHAERVVSIDDLLVAHAFAAKIDLAMNHYETRMEYAKQLGEALAIKADRQLLQVAVLTARSGATVTGLPGGSVVTNPASKTDGEVLAGLIFDAGTALDEKNVPEADRVAAIRPAQYSLLAQTTKVINRDWGGAGVYADGKVYKIDNTVLVKTNNLPTTNIASAEAGTKNTYHGNFTNTAAAVWQRGAFGTVKLMDVTTEKEYQLSRKGTLMTADMAVGHGILRPEAAVEIATA